MPSDRFAITSLLFSVLSLNAPPSHRWVGNIGSMMMRVAMTHGNQKRRGKPAQVRWGEGFGRDVYVLEKFSASV